ncbi:MAG: cation:proton antiporter [Tissierellales bacterium]|nr:cation:proton antiporter [Tissierellales bacterium]
MNGFIIVGTCLLVGILLGKLMIRFNIPSVPGYIIAGLILGVSGFKIVNGDNLENFAFISDFALGIIAFNIGSELNIKVLKKMGKSILIIAVCESLGAFTLVTSIMLLLKQPIETALILGAVSSATAPAATVMVLKECKAKGPLTSTLLGVVAVDDAVCLMIYSIAASVAKVFVNHEVVTINKILIHPIMEIVFSIIAGGILGVILAYLLQKARNNTELLSFVIGIIVLLVGLSQAFHLSPLLACMSLGIMIANVSSSANKVFRSIESFSPPIIAAFFVFAGARLDISLIPHIGLVGVLYLTFRVLGKVLGAALGGKLSKAPSVVTKNLGFGLISQVGVAIGLAITVQHEFAGTDLAVLVLTVLLATTILTEIIGPILTKKAIIRSGEANL